MVRRRGGEERKEGRGGEEGGDGRKEGRRW